MAATSKDEIKTITTHYIDGAFVESHGREVMDIIKPTNGKVIARVTLADEEDTRRAIAAAKRAFATYGRSTKEERAEILRRLHAAASARVDELTAAMVEEYGGVVQFARLIVQSGVNAFQAAEKALGEMEWTRSWGKTTVTLEPVGVAGLITAWNANALFICLKLASAVAAGCTVVIKPSELSSLQTRVLIEALHEAKLPKGLLNVVTGLGNVVGAELVRNPDVDKISFTGSVAVGENIMRDGAATMKRVTLELGGKSPTIVLDDADLDQAIPAALGMAFMNSGQACAAGTRLLVPSKRLDAAKRAIVKAMRAFTVGDPADPKIAVGPMVSQKQYERVQSYIRKGIEEGAEVLVGGEGHPEGSRRVLRQADGVRQCEERHDDRPRRDFRPCAQRHRLRFRGRSDCDRQRLQIWSSRRRSRHRPRPRAPRGLSVAGRPGRDQRHDGRSAGAVGRIQIFRRRPGIRPIRYRGVSRNPRHPGGLRRTLDEQTRRHLAGGGRGSSAIRSLEAYAHCADRRDAKGQMALFTTDTHFVVYMNAKDPKPSQELHSREALAPVFADLNQYAATMHFVGQSTIFTLNGDRATGEAYCIAHHLTVDGDKRRLMVAYLRYLDTFAKIDGAWLFAERLLYVDWLEERALS